MNKIEIKRQFVHSLGIFLIFLLFLGREMASLLTFLGIVLLIFFAEYRRCELKLKDIFKLKIVEKLEEHSENFIKGHERPEELPLNGAITFLIGSFFAFVLFPSYIAAASIAVLALGDSISTLIGKYYGKNKIPYNKNKSIEGSLAFFLISLMALLFFINPLNSFFVAIIATFVESLPKLDDNITIPIAVGIAMLV